MELSVRTFGETQTLLCRRLPLLLHMIPSINTRLSSLLIDPVHHEHYHRGFDIEQKRNDKQILLAQAPSVSHHPNDPVDYCPA